MISPDDKILLAKTTNNLALSIFKNVEKSTKFSSSNDTTKSNNLLELKEAIELLNQANGLYIETNNVELSSQTIKNIEIIESFQKNYK